MSSSRFQKGHPKVGGRKKGTPNKTVHKFRDRLEANGVDLEKEMAKAILDGNIEMIKALQSLLPYLQPKLKEQEEPTQPLDANLLALTDEELDQLASLNDDDSTDKPDQVDARTP